MPWSAPSGDTTLSGPAAILYKRALLGLIAHYEQHGNFFSLAGGMTKLPDDQKWYLIERACKCMLGNAPPVDPTAMNSMAAFMPYAFLKHEAEKDGEAFSQQWGAMVASAYPKDEDEEDEEDEENKENEEGEGETKQGNDIREYYLPNIKCTDGMKWWSWVDSVADVIFWDRDWEMEDLFDPEDPETEGKKAWMRIEPDYFDKETFGAIPDTYTIIQRLGHYLRGLDNPTIDR
eukprot:Phypoly_transcript_15931.p1 GENE.Phypoly_transcript_15931~~Phypoly_transcript_15931.p1  ORF type:complete len:233 (+),score=41.26 Phypoly_transcript_15931:108-806(+)